MSVPPTTRSVAKLTPAMSATMKTKLRDTLNAELATHGNSLGLKPGDKVAISSSVGQSISF
jgi:hypothetical protein